MLLLTLMAGPFSFQKAIVAWRVGEDSSVAYIADYGKRVGMFIYRGGELSERGLVLDKKGWKVDMSLMEFSAQEGYFKTPEDLVNFWCTGDPVSKGIVLGHEGMKGEKIGTEEYMGYTCVAYKLTGDDTSNEGKLLRWRGLTLYYRFNVGKEVYECSLMRLDTSSAIPEEKLTLPENIFLVR
ncbi:MAG: hypothetical protein ABIM59_04685 [candidate division WOR-3 bacterium]